jgi:anti-sigma factor RsiW
MSDHRPDQRRLFAFLDGRLAPQEQLELRVHVESCAACKTQLETLRRTRGALRTLGERMPVPPAQHPNAEAKLIQSLGKQGAPGTRVQWWWLPVTAGATLALALLVLPRLRGASESGGPAMAQVENVAPAAAGGTVATVLSIRGQVQEGLALEALHAGKAGEELPASAMVRTGADGEIRLSLAAGGEIDLVPGSSVVLPAEPKGVIKLEAGSIDVQVVPRAEGERPFGIETDLARIEAIGTKFRVVHDGGFTTVDVTEGKVRFVSLGSEEEQLVVAGKAAKIDSSGKLAETPSLLSQVAVAPETLVVPETPETPVAVEPPVESPETESDIVEQPVQIEHPRGTIDAGRVRSRVSRQRGAFQACYNDYVMRVAPQPVEARVRFIVLENGAVGPIEVGLSVEDQPLRECVERVFRAIEFPRPQGGPARVFYPVQLSL